jgi:hypothetical protein
MIHTITGMHLGDGGKGMARMPPLSVDLTITSPPYGTLRVYGGHPFDWQEFASIADQLWRVTRQGGIVCWQEGDQMVDGSFTDTSYRHLLYFRTLGFRHYDTLYTSVPGARRRGRHYSSPPQNLFVLSKGRPTTICLLKVPNKTAGQMSGTGDRNKYGYFASRQRRMIADEGTRNCYWTYHSANHTELPYRRLPHGGTMHQYLARDLILSYSRPLDLVLDPMAGLGTTAKWATLLGRRCVGFEIHEPYCQWANRRLEDARTESMRAFTQSITRV